MIIPGITIEDNSLIIQVLPDHIANTGIPLYIKDQVL